MECVKLEWVEKTNTGKNKKNFAYFINEKVARKFEIGLLNNPIVITQPILTTGISRSEIVYQK